MQLDKWLLTIKFDDLKIQEERDPELAFPNDELSQTVTKLMAIWGGLPEEFQEDASWNDILIEVTFDNLQYIADFMTWLVSETIPRTVSLTREDT